jgi:hypothetical protein
MASVDALEKRVKELERQVARLTRHLGIVAAQAGATDALDVVRADEKDHSAEQADDARKKFSAATRRSR